MKNKIGFVTGVIAVLINIIILVYGLNLRSGDEMGFSLIAFYAVMPLTAIISCLIMAKVGFIGSIPFGIILSAAAILIPYTIFGTFEPITVFFGMFPCAIGLAIGYALKK